MTMTDLFYALIILAAVAGLVFSVCNRLASRGNRKATRPYSIFRRKFRLPDLFLAVCLELNALLLLGRVLIHDEDNPADLTLAACLLPNMLLLAYLRLDSRKRPVSAKALLLACLALDAVFAVWHLCKHGVDLLLAPCLLLNAILLVRFWIPSHRSPAVTPRFEPELGIPVSKAAKFLSSAVSFCILAILSFAFLLVVFGIEYCLVLRYVMNQ